MKMKITSSAALLVLAGTASLGAIAQDYMMPSDTPRYIRQAIESDARAEEMTVRDAARKPAQILMLSGVAPGDHVIEIAGFGQYYTTILSDIVGDDGVVSMYDLPYTGARGGGASAGFVAEHENTEYHLGAYDNAAFPDDVDVAFNVLYYHDLGLQPVDRAAMNR